MDEFTAGFLKTSHAFFRDSESEEAYFKASAQDYTNGIAEAEADFATFLKLAPGESNFSYALGTLAALDMPPAYRSKWNLAQDPKLPEGITYMASLNPREPACFVMLGVVSWKQGDLLRECTIPHWYLSLKHILELQFFHQFSIELENIRRTKWQT